MRFGVFAAIASPFASPATIAALGRACDDHGVDSIWVPEHVVLFADYESSYPYSPDGKVPAPPDAGMFEPLTTLAFLAAHTTRVRLGTGICLLPQRNPVYTAKEVANVDYLSGGRVDFGVGVGWLEEEFRVVNVPFAERGKRTDEYIEILRTLWTTDPSEYHGALYDLPSCSLFPKPVQPGGVPIHIGGESEAAMRRAARIGDGWHTFNRLPDDVPPLLARLDELCAEHGRSRSDLQVTVSPYFNGIDEGMVAGFVEAGVDEVTALVFVSSPDEAERAVADLVPCIERAHAG